jgi:uncharacterized membrane protein YsdA (DUF1294 family)
MFYQLTFIILFTYYNASLETFGLYRRDKAQANKPTAYRETLRPAVYHTKG